jgi:hypothetical protein
MTIDQALTLAFQFVNQPMADLAIKEMADDLARHPQENVLAALRRCRSELKAIRYGDILDRLPGGHPGPENAWSIVQRGMQNEALTMVWTDEMREAYGVAAALSDDPVAARMAFKETYQQLVSVSRSKNAPVNWSVSQGTDKSDRELQITEAVKAGRLRLEYAKRLLPHPDDPNTLALLEKLYPRLLS